MLFDFSEQTVQSVALVKCSSMLHFIWVFTVYQNTCLGKIHVKADVTILDFNMNTIDVSTQ